jgi:hypothetical protein
VTYRRGHPWTDVDDDELRRLIVAGETPLRIARQLGRSQEAITARKVRLRLRHG